MEIVLSIDCSLCDSPFLSNAVVLGVMCSKVSINHTTMQFFLIIYAWLFIFTVIGMLVVLNYLKKLQSCMIYTYFWTFLLKLRQRFIPSLLMTSTKLSSSLNFLARIFGRNKTWSVNSASKILLNVWNCVAGFLYFYACNSFKFFLDFLSKRNDSEQYYTLPT